MADRSHDVRRDGQGQVIQVDLRGSPVTDKELVHLKRLTKLQDLNLSSTKVTDAGLVHLKALTNLQDLNLSFTKVTDAGLVHLAGMNLKSLTPPKEAMTDLGLKYYLAAVERPSTLSLGKWKITDAGLVHLKGLTKLQELDLHNTKITNAGIADLQKALPNCQIRKPNGKASRPGKRRWWVR